MEQTLLVGGDPDGTAEPLLAALAGALRRHGRRLVAVDLPAQGASDGVTTSIPASARALLALQREVGAFDAVVAHSVGAAVAVEAMAHGLVVGRAVLIAAPAHYRDYAVAFGAATGLDAAATGQMLAELARRGVDAAAVSLPARAARLRQPALFVHSDDDRVVPLRDALDGQRAWRGARLLRVEGLGHRRLLSAPVVIDAVLDFVVEDALAETEES